MNIDPGDENSTSDPVGFLQKLEEEPLDEWKSNKKLFNCLICKYSTNIKDNIEAHYVATHNISRDLSVAGMAQEISSEEGTSLELRGTEGHVKTPEIDNGVVQIVPESILLKEEEEEEKNIGKEPKFRAN